MSELAVADQPPSDAPAEVTPIGGETREHHKRLTPEEEKKISAYHREGMKNVEIAREINRHPSVIDRAIHRLFSGTPGRRPKMGNQRWSTRARTDLDPQIILKLRQQGMNVAQIAKHMKASSSSIGRILEKAKQERPAHTISTKGRANIAKAQRERWRKARQQSPGNQRAFSGVADIASQTLTGNTRQRAPKYSSSRFPCPECGKGFGYRHNMERHLREAHGKEDGRKKLKPGQMVITRNADGRYPCPECERTFGSDVGCFGHMKTHHGAKQRPRFVNQRNEAPAIETPSRKESTNGSQPNPDPTPQLNQHIIFLFAGFQKEIQIYGDEHEIPWKILAAGVAELFQLSTRRQRVGSQHSMPALSGITA